MASDITHTRAGRVQGERGFTLIEMAIAVAIFGMLASGAILATSAWLGKQALDKTQKNLDRIESALTLYVVQSHALPCPYDPEKAPGGYVGSDCADTTPAAFVGLVPYRDLGLQRTDVLDGWNRYITYAVDAKWAENGTTGFRSGGALRKLNEFDPDSPYLFERGGANLLVQDAAKAACSPGQANCAGYILISHGEAGNGAYINFGSATQFNGAGGNTVAAESENNDGDEVFAAEAFTDPPADTQFDHIVRFRTPAQILRDAW